MITIIGDTYKELSELQTIIDSGVLNVPNCDDDVSIEVTYKLSSKDVLLANKYGHIVGSKPEKECERVMMADIMEFPETFDEFARTYGFMDIDEYYTNGSNLIPVFRVKQWLEHEHKKTRAN